LDKPTAIAKARRLQIVLKGTEHRRDLEQVGGIVRLGIAATAVAKDQRIIFNGNK
jgi:hypothetical protein